MAFSESLTDGPIGTRMFVEQLMAKAGGLLIIYKVLVGNIFHFNMCNASKQQ